jgi:tetratricopeptide (TPR) repeat protein
MLRLASLKMVEMDLEAADKALERAGALSDDPSLRFLGGVRACRVAIRRGERERPAALLIGAASRLEAIGDDSPAWRPVAVEVALGIAELELHADEPDASAFEGLEEIEDPDPAFTAHQLRATYLITIGQSDKAAHALRAALNIAVAHDSPEDEVEMRLALAGVLVERGDAIGLEEATRHVQAAREKNPSDALQIAALIGQAGVLARRGKVASAIDRCLEIARLGAAQGDAPRLVAAVGLMAELYGQTGDYASAYRTIAEAYQGLRDATGKDVEPLFRPHLAALRDRMGGDRFDRMIEDVRKARMLADNLTTESRSH